jgi:hypothetical protein
MEQAGNRALEELKYKRDLERSAVTTLTPEEEAAAGLPSEGVYQRAGTGAISRVETPAVAETYGPVISGDQAKALGLDPTKSYQLNQKTNQYDQVGGGGTSVTINPPSAETSAKLGLARGFLDNYDSILKSVDAGEMTGGGYISGVQLGRGNGGTQYRNLKQGTEALIRIMTGAGMSENEAVERSQQFEPQITDDAPTLRSKVQGLKQAIDNVIQGVQTRGQPGAAAQPDTAAPDAGGGTPPADGGRDLTNAPDDQVPQKNDYVVKNGITYVYSGQGDPADTSNWIVKQQQGGQ